MNRFLITKFCKNKFCGYRSAIEKGNLSHNPEVEFRELLIFSSVNYASWVRGYDERTTFCLINNFFVVDFAI